MAWRRRLGDLDWRVLGFRLQELELELDIRDGRIWGAGVTKLGIPTEDLVYFTAVFLLLHFG